MSAPLTVLAALGGCTVAGEAWHRRAGVAADASVTLGGGDRDGGPDQRRTVADGCGPQRQSARVRSIRRAILGKPGTILRNAGRAETGLDTGESFLISWTSFHNFDHARAVPQPLQTPHPPIRITPGASEDTFPVLGALGYPLFVSVRSGSLAGLAPDLHAYREAYVAAGHKGKGEVHLRLSLHVAETDKEAQAQAHDSVMAGYQKLVSQLEGSPNTQRRAELADVKSLTYDAVMRDKVVIGSPKTVAARLSDLQDQLGIDGILAELDFWRDDSTGSDDAVITAIVAGSKATAARGAPRTQGQTRRRRNQPRLHALRLVP